MPMLPPDGLRSLRRWLPVAAAALALSSCSVPGAPAAKTAKVDVDRLETDILFGAPTTRTTAPAAAAPAPPPQALPPLFVPPTQPSDQFFTGNNFTPTTPAIAPCPKAPSTAFPATVATSDVTTMPTPGHYRWAASGSYDYTVLTQTVKLPLPPFQDRYVRNAAPFNDPVPALPGSSPDYAFTYQTIEPQVSPHGYFLMYWQVKAGAATGDPENGLVLRQIDRLDADFKNPTTIFKAVVGLLFITVPVQPGSTINSTSADTSGSGGSLQIQATVGNHENVDACGEPIQAWAVDGTLTQTGAGAASPANIHYDVATQYGALIVAFNVKDGSFLGTSYHDANTRIGQVKPDVLPDKFK